jgi:hypothetical protein
MPSWHRQGQFYRLPFTKVHWYLSSLQNNQASCGKHVITLSYWLAYAIGAQPHPCHVLNLHAKKYEPPLTFYSLLVT